MDVLEDFVELVHGHLPGCLRGLREVQRYVLCEAEPGSPHQFAKPECTVFLQARFYGLQADACGDLKILDH